MTPEEAQELLTSFQDDLMPQLRKVFFWIAAISAGIGALTTLFVLLTLAALR